MWEKNLIKNIYTDAVFYFKGTFLESLLEQEHHKNERKPTKEENMTSRKVGIYRRRDANTTPKLITKQGHRTTRGSRSGR